MCQGLSGQKPENMSPQSLVIRGSFKALGYVATCFAFCGAYGFFYRDPQHIVWPTFRFVAELAGRSMI